MLYEIANVQHQNSGRFCWINILSNELYKRNRFLCIIAFMNSFYYMTYVC